MLTFYLNRFCSFNQKLKNNVVISFSNHFHAMYLTSFKFLPTLFRYAKIQIWTYWINPIRVDQFSQCQRTIIMANDVITIYCFTDAVKIEQVSGVVPNIWKFDQTFDVAFEQTVVYPIEADKGREATNVCQSKLIANQKSSGRQDGFQSTKGFKN